MLNGEGFQNDKNIFNLVPLKHTDPLWQILSNNCFNDKTSNFDPEISGP